jgi:hypothetical protein
VVVKTRTSGPAGTVVPSPGFVHFRIYGPAAVAFDGSWKPGDFESA